jgi:hypothetical protein
MTEFDLEKFAANRDRRIEIGACEHRITASNRRKPFKAQFVQLPASWIERLERCNSAGAFKLAHRILREAFKRDFVGGEIILSTEVTGLPRMARFRAIKNLVNLGLIKVKQNGHQAVRVTWLLRVQCSRRA